MATDENRRKRFYQELVEDGHVGDEKSYNETMANEASARDLYNKLTTSGWELDDYDTWYEDFGPEKKREQAGTTNPTTAATSSYGHGTTEEQRREFFNTLKADGYVRDEEEYNTIMGSELGARTLYPYLQNAGYNLGDFNSWYADYGPQYYGEPKRKLGWFHAQNGPAHMVPLAQSGGRRVVVRQDGTRLLSWKTRDKRPPLTPRPMPIPGQPNGLNEWKQAANEPLDQRLQKAASMEIPRGSRPMGSEEAVKRWEEKQPHLLHEKLVKDGYTFATNAEVKMVFDMLGKPDTAKQIYDDLRDKGWDLVDFDEFQDILGTGNKYLSQDTHDARNNLIRELLESGYGFDFGNGVTFNQRTDFQAFDDMMSDEKRAIQQYRRLYNAGQADRDINTWLYDYGGFQGSKHRYPTYSDVSDFMPDFGEAMNRDEWEAASQFYQPSELGGKHVKVKRFRSMQPGGSMPIYQQNDKSAAKNRISAEKKIRQWGGMKSFAQLFGEWLLDFFESKEK